MVIAQTLATLSASRVKPKFFLLSWSYDIIKETCRVFWFQGISYSIFANQNEFAIVRIKL